MFIRPFQFIQQLCAFLTFYVVDAIKSAAIKNADSKPATLNPAYQAGGRVRCHRGYGKLVTATAEAGSTIRFCRVRSSDMLKDLVLDHSSFGTGCTMDIGVYRTEADGGAVRDADAFASAIDVSAAGRNVNVLRESGVTSLENMEKRLWELLEYTQDPECDFDIVGTLTAAATVAGEAVLTAEVVGGH